MPLAATGGGGILLNHIENSKRWADTRGQLERLIAWIQRVRADGRDPTLAVGP